MPENLTTWRIKVWGMGHGTNVGQGQTDVVTRKDLIVRLQAPRFFVQKDEVVLSANVHNYLKTKKIGPGGAGTGRQDARSRIGRSLTRHGRRSPPQRRGPRRLARQGARRGRGHHPHEGADRRRVRRHGAAVPLLRPRHVEDGGLLRRHPAQGHHGPVRCRACPRAPAAAAIAARGPLLAHAGRGHGRCPALPGRLSLRLHGADAQPLPAHRHHAEGPPGHEAEPEARSARSGPTSTPRRSATTPSAPSSGSVTGATRSSTRTRSASMVKDGVERLTEMQLSDGGWGWFSGYGEQSWPHTTALVVHGLQLARQNDVAIVPGMLERGVAWLQRYQDEQIQLDQEALREKQPGLPWKEHADELDAFVYMVLVDAGVKNAEMRDFLYRDRTKIAVYAKAMFGLALQQAGREGEARHDPPEHQPVRRSRTTRTRPPGSTCPDDCWWYWYGSEYEAEAYYLKLLARTDPKGELASRLVKYLLNNRKHATYWNTTRDTAIVRRGHGRVPQGQRRGPAGHDRRGLLDGKQHKAVEITAADLFHFDNKFVLEGDAVATGKHEVKLVKEGHRPALLQRLPDQLHPGGLHHQGRPGDQGQAQVLQAHRGRQVDQGGRLARPGGRPEGREVRARGAGEPGHAQERRPGRGRAGDRRARTTTSTWSSRT